MLAGITQKLHLSKRKTWQLLFQYLGGFIFLSLIGIFALAMEPSNFFERKSHDWFHILNWFQPEESAHSSDEFMMIYIDDYSHFELNQPYDRIWSRGLHAELLEKINKDEPKLVCYDLIFNQESSDPAADARFAKAIEANGHVILAASYQRYYYSDNAEPAEKLFAPYAPFRQAAAGWGVVLKQHDAADNSLRRLNRVYDDSRFAPAFWEAAEMVDPQSTKNADDFSRPRWIRHIGPPQSITGVSFSTALQSNTIDFTGKYIFIGARHSVGMPGAGRDVFRSPYLGAPVGEFTGVELFATMVHNILSGSWLSESSHQLYITVVCLVALLLTLLVNPFGPIPSLVHSVILALGISIASVWYIHTEGTFYAWLVPVIVQTPTAFLFSNLCNYYFLARKRNHLKRVFSSYLSPIMVQSIIESEEDPQLGGTEEDITPFFSDVANYSKFSELLSPIDLTRLMNEYLGAMTDVLQDERGTLDKYIGDAVVAFFGAPLPMEDHAYRACRAAVRMQGVQADLRDHWAKSGKWPESVSTMQTRIGLNSGRAVVGNMGSHRLFNYSMSGDTVNLAARAESGAKHFGVVTMVTEFTHDAAMQKGANDLIFRKLNRCTIVGREQPVMLYELMSFENESSDMQLECKALYESALNLYFERDWSGAESILRKSQELENWRAGSEPIIKISPSLALLELCRKYQQTPPGDNWDGILKLQQK
ncbi:MAG: CHASE2 domain-containing protein [Opitutaceae bacterium]